MCVLILSACTHAQSTVPSVPSTSRSQMPVTMSPDLSKKNIFTIFPLPNGTPQAAVAGLAYGSDHNLWATDITRNSIARITPSGAVTEYALPNLDNANAEHVIITGPGGDLWFSAENYIGRVSTSGSFTMYQLPPVGMASDGISRGPDGNVWVTDSVRQSIDRITPSGTITEYQLPQIGNARVWGVAAGADGNLWFTTSNFSQSSAPFGKITTSGSITLFTPPSEMDLRAIVNGPDGNLYAGDFSGNGIVRITTDGVATEFSTSASNFYEPIALTVGPDKRIWIAAFGGQLTEFDPKSDVVSTPAPMPTPGGTYVLGHKGLTVGPNRDVWFTSGDSGSAQYVAAYEEKIYTVGINLNDTPINDPNYGFELGYAVGKGTTTQTIRLAAGEAVRFQNLDSVPHSAAFLGNATANNAPWPTTFTGSTTRSPAGSAIGIAGWSTGSLNANQFSPIYETGLPGFYMIGDQYDYVSNMMRTVIVVQ